MAKITRVDKEGGRFLEVDYGDKNRVQSIYEPMGNDGAKIQTLHLEYHKNTTDVWDALQNKKTYCFDKNDRLETVTYFDKDDVVKQEIYTWDTSKGREGWLKEKSIGLDNYIYCTTSYEYDFNGNPSKIYQRGNITGHGHEKHLNGPSHGFEYHLTEYEYTQDDRNLLLKKTTPEGLTIHYDYLDGTNLKTKELHFYDGQIQRRLFWSYDDNGQILTSIVDDGSTNDLNDLTHVTYRTIKEITPQKESGASFGKPILITESYLDGKTPRLLKSFKIVYDERGLEVSREVYDSQNNFCYALTKKFDSAQRLIEETNPLNQVTTYCYDNQNNRISEETLGTGKQILYSYDICNRCTSKSEEHDDGQSFTTSYRYDALGNIIEETDPYGYKTNYSYDSLGRQTEIVKPNIKNEDPSIRPKIVKQFSILNKVISETDENGSTITASYNIFGQPLRLHFPDNSSEWYFYYRNGLLQTHMFSDSSCIDYEYDGEGKVIREFHYEKPHDTKPKKEKRQIENRYKGRLLLQTTNEFGVITRFSYDGAGRKITETIDDLKTIRYSYDDFDRVITRKEISHDNQTREDSYTYDWLDRILTKTSSDSSGKIYRHEKFDYDANGNQIKIESLVNDQTAVTEFVYNSRNELISKKDPSGSLQRWEYLHSLNNSNDGIAFTIKHYDANNRLDIEEYDLDKHLLNKKIYENNEIAASYKYAYDKKGNLIEQTSENLNINGKTRSYSVVNVINSRGWLASQTELPEEKTTHYFYDCKGRLIKKTFPNQVSLSYKYDSFGRKLFEKSSDGTIDYTYEYEQGDQPVRIVDHVNQITHNRSYDKFDRLLKDETLSGTALQFEYDSFDRLSKIQLPDVSSIAYQYDAFHLRKIDRFSSKNKNLYSYHLDDYDFHGHLLKAHCNSFEISYKYDCSDRLTSVNTPLWSLSSLQYDAINNLKSLRQKDPLGDFSESYTYDRFDHLISEPGHTYKFDHLGNCLKKDKLKYSINASNQIANKDFSYNENGCLTNDGISLYEYDVKNRLIKTPSSTFIYDSFDKCIRNNASVYLYQGDHEIGKLEQNKLKELKIINPLTQQPCVIEIDNKPYFPVQNHRGDICALYNSNGTLAQWLRYGAFGSSNTYGSTSLNLPWQSANRRNVDGLVMYHYRFYNPEIMRWMTPDPLGFKESLNLYRYKCNNPNSYIDPDGRFVIAIPFLTAAISSAGAVTFTVTAEMVAATVTAIVIGTVTSQAITAAKNPEAAVEEEEEKPVKKGRKAGSDNECRGGPPRDKLGNYLPDPAAEGYEHSTFGTRIGSDGEPYLQTIEFGKDGKSKYRTDVSDHGRGDHINPHRHKAKGPNSFERPSEPIPWIVYS